MRFNLANQSLLINAVCLLLLGFIVLGPLGLIPTLDMGTWGAVEPQGEVLAPEYCSFIEQWLINAASQRPTWAHIATLLLLLLNSFFLTRIVIRNLVYMSGAFVPALFFLIVSFALFGEPSIALAAALAVLLILNALSLMLGSYAVPSPASGTWFMASVCATASALIYTPALLGIPVLFIGLLTLRRFDLREWVATIGGIGIMLFYGSYIELLAGGKFFNFLSTAGAMICDFEPLQVPTDVIERYSSIQLVLVVAIIGACLMSLLVVVRNFTNVKPQIFRSFVFTNLSLLFMTVAMLLSGVNCDLFLPIIAIFIGMSLPIYFNRYGNTWLANLLLGVIIVAAILASYLAI